MKKILVLNGPNLNLVGIREPEIYGVRGYSELVDYIRSCGESLGVEVDVRQSNHEGVLIDWIHEALNVFDGLVINAGGYTHTSIAIMDAIKGVGLRAVEVHLSDIRIRDPFRRLSYVGKVCERSFIGRGFESYRLALEYLTLGDSR
ncbi:MAG: 3-dehydroquinate dehydratase [Lentisphaerae bacterium]|jgi:3-dehydroquinate dehydratase-2|nr:3-dehydroquinate dehydratase [Lentisphaerota bacterium]